MITCSRTFPSPAFLTQHLMFTCYSTICCLNLSHSRVITLRTGSVPFPTRAQAKDSLGAKFPCRGGVSPWGLD